MHRIASLLLLVALIFSATPALAQSDAGDDRFNRKSCKPVDAKDLEDVSGLIAKGYKFVRAVCKLVRVQGDKLYLDGVSSRADVRISRNNIGIQRELINNVKNRVDNIELFGYLKNGRFTVKNWRKLESDIKIFREKIENATAAENADALFDLAEELEESDHLPNADELRKKALRNGLEIERDDLPKNNPSAAFKLAVRYIELLEAKKEALQLLSRCLRIDPLYRPALEKVGELEGVPYGGEWILFDELKQREGFKLVDGRWMSDRELALHKVIEEHQESNIGFLPYQELPSEWEPMVEQGRVAQNMGRDWIVRAVGYPDHVIRKRVGKFVYEQWVYEGSNTFYLGGKAIDQAYVFKSE